MRVKTIVALVIVIFVTVIIMQNTGEVRFTILFGDIYISKLVMLTAMSVLGFILGVLVTYPKNKKYDIEKYHDSIHEKEDPNTLSDEDREYIS